MPLFGRPDVSGLEARRDAKELANALKYKLGRTDPETAAVHSGAARALGRIGDPRSVEPLTAALGRADGSDVHVAVAQALGMIGDARAVDALVAALSGSSSDSRVREAAAEALGSIGDVRAVEPLIAALDDDIKQVRRATAGSLARVGDVRAVEPLIAALADADKGLSCAIVEGLGRIGDARAVESLISKINDADADVSGAAAEALVLIGAAAVQPLTAALKTRKANANASTAKVLVKVLDSIGPDEVEPLKSAVGSLSACLDGGDQSLRRSAARLLGMIGDTHASDRLVAALVDRSPEVVRAAAGALTELGWQPDRSAAGAAYWASQGASDKCVEIGPAAIPSLIAALKDRHRLVRHAAVAALAGIGTPAVEPLIVALNDGGKDVRTGAAQVLGEIGDARAVMPLIASLSDRGEDVRVAARRALAWIGTPAVEPLIAALRDSPDWQVYLREQIGQALGQFGARAVEPLIAALGDPDVLVRWIAAETLGEIGDDRAVQPLIAVLEDREVRQAAAEALDKLGRQPEVATGLRLVEVGELEARVEALDR